MKRAYFFFIKYQIEFLTFIFALLLSLASFSFFTDPNKQLTASVAVILASLLVIILTRYKEKSFIYSALTWRSDKTKWIGYGDFDLSKAKGSFMLTNADPGFIYSNCLNWTNYFIEFDFQIGTNCLGVILRAVNLSNYIMLQVTTSGIRPHIRINGGWAVWEAKQVNLDNNLSLDKWYHAKITCENSEIFIQLYDNNQKIFDRVWKMPTGNLVFNFKKDEKDPGVNIPFPINLEFGSAGFRNFGYEKAFIKSVLIQKI